MEMNCPKFGDPARARHDAHLPGGVLIPLIKPLFFKIIYYKINFFIWATFSQSVGPVPSNPSWTVRRCQRGRFPEQMARA